MARTQLDGVAGLLAERWKQAAEKLERIAAAIPADKYEWRPAEEVRTCGDVLRHAAFWNQYLAASIREEKADDSLNELPRVDFPNKDAVLAALGSSSTDVSKALKAASASMSTETAVSVLTFLEHSSEHYGQLAVYCRLLGIVPPASRG